MTIKWTVPAAAPAPRTDAMWHKVKHAIDSVDAVLICESSRDLEHEHAEEAGYKKGLRDGESLAAKKDEA